MTEFDTCSNVYSQLEETIDELTAAKNKIVELGNIINASESKLASAKLNNVEKVLKLELKIDALEKELWITKTSAKLHKDATE